ncbi:MAG: hypothetical protein IJ085_07550 [Turicibacter sp.]|nr:hypothetical protein [Turicibacter sp.]
MIKKIGMIVMMLSLVGCNSVENVVKIEVQSEEQHEVKNEEQTEVYSFTGENEALSLYNGVIVLSPTKQILYGGELQNNQEDVSDVLNYSVEFFILSDEGKESLFTYGTGDMTKERDGLTRENLIVPGITSEEIFTTNIQENIKNNFYVEVTITKINGDKQSYQIKLEATEVTPNIHNY